jgi:acetyl-CoA carboxylase carboxyltransferase component
MGGAQAAKTLMQIQVATLKAKGKEISPQEEQRLFNEIKERYDHQTSPYYAASRLWVDAIIDPIQTRTWISMGIEAANNAPVEKFNVGVLQT